MIPLYLLLGEIVFRLTWVKTMKELEEAIMKGYITCPRCDNLIEPDCLRCYCGWKNPLVEQGLK
ncbi:hypothetical protein MBGDF03_01240 [Thermoplasmatales archaeon SCGC AB-540-F20]|nr:hypothetical protein MBGDF03_01240 [Thermoplasmatales archaeon SCGC AB-540-F20]